MTEMVCGIESGARSRSRIAAGAALGYGQGDIRFSGHAIECRITAEDPASFVPTPGRVTAFHAPGGLGVRVDFALYAGYFVPPYYDSLVAKLIVHAPTRADAISRMRRACSASSPSWGFRPRSRCISALSMTRRSSGGITPCIGWRSSGALISEVERRPKLG